MGKALDAVLEHGWLIDGSGAQRRRADVGIMGDRIAAVGDLRSADAERRLDIEGRIVTPGFIDMHSHSDKSILAYPEATSRVAQGITTELAGNCGGSSAPVTDERLEDALALNRGQEPEMDYTWRTMADFLARVEQARPAVNMACLVGHGTVRAAVMGFARRAPRPDELQAMRRLVDEAMADGAYGLSTGLLYAPGSYADEDEVVALAEVAASHGGLYASHIRNEAAGLWDSVDEAMAVGRRARLPVQISHLKAVGLNQHGRLKGVLGRIAGERARGLDVAGDFYPYTASSTTLRALLPSWVQEDGIDAMTARLRSREVRERLVQEFRHGLAGWTNHVGAMGGSWAGVMIVHLQTGPNAALVGQRIPEVARTRGQAELDAVCDLLIEEAGAVQIVNFAMADVDVAAAARTPWVMMGTDGSAIAPRARATRRVHPRAYGTTARFLRDHTGGDGLTWEEAVWRMTGLPAHRLGLVDRGCVEAGGLADLVVLDPERVEDRATYEEPHRTPSGVLHVFVNGVLALLDGELSGARPGRVLRKASGAA